MYACYCKTSRLQFGISGHWYWQTEQFGGQTIPKNTSETQRGLGTKTTVMPMLQKYTHILLLGDGINSIDNQRIRPELHLHPNQTMFSLISKCLQILVCYALTLHNMLLTLYSKVLK